MARSRVSRAESQQRTRELLLVAATEVFSRRGYHAATVEEVAETAGYSKGAVYANFASKQELFLALLDRHLEQTFDALSRNIMLEAVQGESLTTLQGITFSTYLQEQRTWNVLAMEFWLYAQRNEQARERLRTRYSGARAMLGTHLHERYKSGQSQPPMPFEYLAWAILAVGSGLTLQAYLEAQDAMPSELYATVIDRLLGSSPA